MRFRFELKDKPLIHAIMATATMNLKYSNWNLAILTLLNFMLYSYEIVHTVENYLYQSEYSSYFDVLNEFKDILTGNYSLYFTYFDSEFDSDSY